MPSTRRNGVRSAEIGREAETGVVRVLHANGFPYAERRRVRREDALDVIVSPSVIASVKGGKQAKDASLKDIADWQAEADAKRRATGDDVCLLVVQRNGYSPDRADHWRTWVLGPFLVGIDLARWETDLTTAATFIRSLGYGTPLEQHDRPLDPGGRDQHHQLRHRRLAGARSLPQRRPRRLQSTPR